MPETMTKTIGHNPRQNDPEATDAQISIGNLKEPGLMEVDREAFQEGRSEKPEIKTHLIDPVTRAEFAKMQVLVKAAIDLIYQSEPTLRAIDQITTLIKEYEEKDEEVEKTNIPYKPPRKDSVAVLSPEELEEKRTGV
jgi:hypothetical protein